MCRLQCCRPRVPARTPPHPNARPGPSPSLTWRRAALLHVEEALLEGHVQGADGPLLLAVLLQVVDGAPVADAVRRRARVVVVVVVAVDAAQTLQVPHDVHRVLVEQRVLGQVLDLRDDNKLSQRQSRQTSSIRVSRTHLLVPAKRELGRGQDVRQRAEAMEQHGRKLDDQDEREEEHEHQTDGLQLEVLLGDEHLRQGRRVKGGGGGAAGGGVG